MSLQGQQGEIKIYTTPWCPFCHRAKALLGSKKVEFQEINVDGQPEVRKQLQDLTGSRTVPQIFIHGKSIGGCDDLYALDRQGSLDQMLAS